MKSYIKALLLKILEANGTVYYPMWRHAERICPICGYEGRFRPHGLYYIRPDCKCPSCGSAERHRQIALFLDDEPEVITPVSQVLHFAPEPVVGDVIRKRTAHYITADLFRDGVDHAWNIEDIDCPDHHFDVVVCSHVLEHVDTAQALSELHRILKPGGRALLMVPICEGLDQTYYNADVDTDAERWKHFQQADHVRVLGRDFRDIIRAAGFSLTERVAEGATAATYGLVMGERIFVAEANH